MFLELYDPVNKKAYIPQCSTAYFDEISGGPLLLDVRGRGLTFDNININFVLNKRGIPEHYRDILNLLRTNLTMSTPRSEIEDNIGSSTLLLILFLESGEAVRILTKGSNPEGDKIDIDYLVGESDIAFGSGNEYLTHIFASLGAVGLEPLHKVFVMAEKFQAAQYPIHEFDYSDVNEVKVIKYAGPSKCFIEKFPKLMEPKLKAMEAREQ